MFTACDKKENSYNFAQILYPNGSGSVIYADQTVDTLKFATTYSWSLSTDADWIHWTEKDASGVVPEGYYETKHVKLAVEPNLTGKTRVAMVNFHADGKVLTTQYGQLHYLDLRYPVMKDEQFVLSDSANQVRDSLVFQTYADEWTLAFKGEKPEWIRFADNAKVTGKAGKYTVNCLLEPNTTESERVASLNLKSNGVSVDIHLKQAGQKKK